MKALREFFVVILSFVLIFLITSLGLFISLKDLVQTSIVTESVKSIVKSEDYTPEQQKEIDEAIERIASDKEINELIDLALQDVTKSGGKELTVSDETIDKFISIIENNKKELIQFGVKEEEINQFITEVQDPKNREEMKQEISKGYEELNINVDGSQTVNVISAYGEIVNPKNISRLGIAIAVVVVLIALLKWSLYEWIRPCSISSIVSGINVLIIYFGIDFIAKSLLSDPEIHLSINTKTLSTVGYSLLGGGIVSLIIYIVIKILVPKNKPVEATTPVVEEKKHLLTEEIPVGEKDVPIEKDPINPEKFCSGCGAPVSEDDEICGSCGAPLDK